ncbi:MAG TPA: ATP-binding protein, partial [Candidatus Tectomicrobia bacterium]
RLFEAYRSPSDRLTLRVHAEPVWLEVATAIPCGLLVTELVTNSFKHAFPNGMEGEVHVTLRQDPPGTCILIIGDTGVGLPESLDVRAAESLGWQLVLLLTERLGGTIALEGQRGTTVTITFPL